LKVRSSVSSPIFVDGRLWGVLTLASPKPLPPQTEDGLEGFTDLVATAIANAESRAAVERLADEQSVLRRAATMVVEGVSPADIITDVCEEVARLFGSDTAAVVRFENDPPSFRVVGVGRGIPGIRAGTRSELHDGLAVTQVYRTGRVARIDGRGLKTVVRPIAEAAGALGVTSTVATPISVEGSLWGALTVAGTKPLPTDAEARLERFGELLATAIAHAHSRAQVAASRRRIVAASDEARRRIERDLHDGTQQRLIALGLSVRAATSLVPNDRDDLRSELAHIANGLADAVTELQEISRGIHPAVLSKGGLGPAARALARRSPIPVELEVDMKARMSEPVEVAAYYVLSEALANATKHSKASRIDMSVRQRDRDVLLSIRDDGVGGADPTRGSGLIGLTDRVDALGGEIRVESRPRDGTRITVSFPIEVEPTL
jgi:signal transduction histidine kinase